MKEFLPVYIPSKDNVANLFTKLLPRDTTRNFTVDLGLYKLEEVWEQREQDTIPFRRVLAKT